jgi:ABC-type sugar transport system substrate-binding protein
MSRAVVVMLALAAVGAGVLVSGSNGARQAQRSIGLVLPDPKTGGLISAPVELGGRAAARALGDHLVVIPADGSDAMTSAVNSLVAQHASAIVVSTDEGQDTVHAVLPALAKARAAGIPTLSFEQRFPGSVWVSQSAPEQYAHALVDALASQMHRRGRYVIVPCRPAETIVATWLKATEAYTPRRYPNMQRVGVVYGGTGNGDAGTLVLAPLLRAHPQLRGLIFLCPSESYTGPPQLVKAHKVGEVFSAGNGADCPPLYSAYAWNVRRGAEEIVCAGDPIKLGYLTVWAADHLGRGHTFTARRYAVGGPVGGVSYDASAQELPLGRPITITRANLAEYTRK